MKKLLGVFGVILGTVSWFLLGHRLNPYGGETLIAFKEMPETLIFTGDTGKCNKGFYALAKQMSLNSSDITINGDLKYNTGFTKEKDFDECIASTFKLENVFLTFGNHDLYKGKARERYFGYAAKYDNIHLPNDYYMVNYGDGELCVIYWNTYLYETFFQSDLEEAQDEFIKDNLNVCATTFISGHHGPYSSGKSHSKDKRPKRLLRMYSILKGNVDAIISGHEHVTAREKNLGPTKVYTAGAGSKLNKCVDNPTCIDDVLGYVEYKVKGQSFHIKTLLEE